MYHNVGFTIRLKGQNSLDGGVSGSGIDLLRGLFTAFQFFSILQLEQKIKKNNSQHICTGLRIYQTAIPLSYKPSNQGGWQFYDLINSVFNFK